MISLTGIAEHFGTDKVSKDSHTHFNKNYMNIYEKYLEPMRNEPIRFLEIGVLDGRSLYSWRSYFTNGEVYGIDIQQSCKRYENKDMKVFVYILDCSSDEKLEEFVKLFPNYFDVILDDGSHINDITVKTFNSLYKCLKNEGLYMIEDLGCAYMGERLKKDIYHWPGCNLIDSKLLSDLNNNPQTMYDLYNEIHRSVDMPSSKVDGVRYGIEWFHHYPAIAIMKKNERYLKNDNDEARSLLE
jgi:hypothetical protein